MDEEEIVPEKRLVAAILIQAMNDAQTPKGSYGVEAIEFLMSKRSDRYFSLVDIDATVFREKLYAFAYGSKPGELSIISTARRATKINIEIAEKVYGMSFFI